MNVMDLKSMLDNYEENRRLKRKHKAIDIIGDDKNTKKLKKVKPKGEFSVLLPGNRDTDTTNVNVVSQLFKGMVFYIVNLGAQAESNKVTKQILETFIAQYGGNKVQNYIPGVTHVIGEDLDYKTQNLIGLAKCDIYHYQWLIKCIERQELVELAPKYFVYCTESTRAKIGKEVDQYGDPYYNDTDANKLEELIEEMGSIIPEDEAVQILKVLLLARLRTNSKQ
jgi:DNA ligase-4